MFDIGWSEFLLIAVVALVAIGPKELPGVLRTLGQWVRKARKMASEFQGQFQEALREAEMADLKQSFDEVREAAKGFSGRGLLASLENDVSSALRIDDQDKPAETKAAEQPAPPALEPPVMPTRPEAPAPQTFVEAEAHAASEPLALVEEAPHETQQDNRQEGQPAAAPEEAAAAAADGLKDAKAS